MSGLSALEEGRVWHAYRKKSVWVARRGRIERVVVTCKRGRMRETPVQRDDSECGISSAYSSPAITEQGGPSVVAEDVAVIPTVEALDEIPTADGSEVALINLARGERGIELLIVSKIWRQIFEKISGERNGFQLFTAAEGVVRIWINAGRAKGRCGKGYQRLCRKHRSELFVSVEALLWPMPAYRLICFRKVDARMRR